MNETNSYIRLSPVALAVSALIREIQIEARVRAASQKILNMPG